MVKELRLNQKESKMRYLVLMLLVGCATTHIQGVPCQTTCGVRLYGSNDCRGLQEAENKALGVYEKHLKNSCDRLYGWVIYIQPTETRTGAWEDSKGRAVLGMTYCRQQTIQLGTDDWHYSSYAHELLHAIECGENLGNEGHNDHQWETGWEDEAVRKAK